MTKKTLIALAILGAFTGVASAQTSVTVYGVADAGLVFEGGGAAGSVTKLSTGVQSGTRLGFKGVEDLGGGLSAKFLLETGIKIDTGGFNQGGTAFGRQDYVGLEGGFGSVTLGRQYTPVFIFGWHH
jgi:predicted porin